MTATPLILYEYPLSERIRTLLRLEDLQDKFNYFVAQDHPYPHHSALVTLFEILEVAGRADLKTDLLQELERQRQVLNSFRHAPNVALDTLDQILQEIEQVQQQLVNTQGKPGQYLRDNEWLVSVRSRTIIPGGACEFDLPSYYAWQHKTAQERRTDIQSWFAPMQPLCDAMRIVLRLLRESGQRLEVVATQGGYQQMLGGKQYQMLQVRLQDDFLEAIPEISANKYMLWVRFTRLDGSLKPKTLERDVPFEMVLCNL